TGERTVDGEAIGGERAVETRPGDRQAQQRHRIVGAERLPLRSGRRHRAGEGGKHEKGGKRAGHRHLPSGWSVPSGPFGSTAAWRSNPANVRISTVMPRVHGQLALDRKAKCHYGNGNFFQEAA